MVGKGKVRMISSGLDVYMCIRWIDWLIYITRPSSGLDTGLLGHGELLDMPVHGVLVWKACKPVRQLALFTVLLHDEDTHIDNCNSGSHLEGFSLMYLQQILKEQGLCNQKLKWRMEIGRLTLLFIWPIDQLPSWIFLANIRREKRKTKRQKVPLPPSTLYINFSTPYGQLRRE